MRLLRSVHAIPEGEEELKGTIQPRGGGIVLNVTFTLADLCWQRRHSSSPSLIGLVVFSAVDLAQAMTTEFLGNAHRLAFLFDLPRSLLGAWKRLWQLDARSFSRWSTNGCDGTQKVRRWQLSGSWHQPRFTQVQVPHLCQCSGCQSAGLPGFHIYMQERFEVDIKDLREY